MWTVTSVEGGEKDHRGWHYLHKPEQPQNHVSKQATEQQKEMKIKEKNKVATSNFIVLLK